MHSDNQLPLRSGNPPVSKVGDLAPNTTSTASKFLPRSLQSANDIDNTHSNVKNDHNMFKSFSFNNRRGDYSLKSVPMLPPKIKLPNIDPPEDDMLPNRKPSEQLDPFTPHATANNTISSDPVSTDNSRNGSFFKRFPSISIMNDFNDDMWKRDGSLSKLGSTASGGDVEIMDSFGNFIGLGQRQRTPSIFFPVTATTGSNSSSFQKNSIGLINTQSSPSIPLIPPMVNGPIIPHQPIDTPQIPIIPWGEQHDAQQHFNDQDEEEENQHTRSKRRKPNRHDMSNDEKPVVGATKVDQLMLLINARKNGIIGDIKQNEEGNIIDNSLLPDSNDLVGGVEKHHIKGNKNHECKFCHKMFTQSTHLEVHIRSHMGLKPYKCEFCDKRFTQGGNLRTHMRLHTGEKPFKCSKCGKLFSRKGNLQAHELTHEKKKPFVCKFDHCNKEFTQLGNMKAHQNRFHQGTLNKFTKLLASLNQAGIDALPPNEMELLDYFSGLYKNLNKGIKGRGKSTK